MGGLRFLWSPKVLIALFLAWALFEGLFSQHSIIKLRHCMQERDKVQEEIAQAELQIAEYREWLDRLDNDPYFVEKMARERLGMVREGEIVYRYEDEPREAPDQGTVRPPIVDETDLEAPE